MLTKIREKFTGGIAIAILALIGIPFLFFGVGNYTFIGQQFAAKVDGSEIGVGQFEQAYRDQLTAIQRGHSCRMSTACRSARAFSTR